MAARKDAQIWKLKGVNRPIVKIEYTVYELHCQKVTEYDASRLWHGIVAPKGAKMLATIKVPRNDAKSALWALDKWLK
jgi:hypothetical protein